MIISAAHLYKQETGSIAVVEEDMELNVFRSKGVWVLDIDDYEKMKLAGIRHGIIRFTRTDPDYLQWLEEKVVELTKQISNANHTGRK